MFDFLFVKVVVRQCVAHLRCLIAWLGIARQLWSPQRRLHVPAVQAVAIGLLLALLLEAAEAGLAPKSSGGSQTRQTPVPLTAGRPALQGLTGAARRPWTM